MSERDIPKWEADEEATECFLCEEKYNFFHRRHHCRKCGRVVCGDCSEQFLKYFPNTPIVSGPGSRGETLEANCSYRTCDECAADVRMVGRVLMGERTDSERRGEDRNREEQRKPDEESDDNLCPICASNLLKKYKGPVESEQDKEQLERFKESHVDDCLRAFDFSRNQSRGNRRSKSQRNKMLVYNMPPIPKPKYETIGNEGSSSVDTTGSQRDLNQRVRHSNSETLEQKASLPNEDEKYLEDECVICLEEMRPGDKVGRLECLCVFHYKCIKDWFNKKGHGECPVHFLAH